MKTIALRKATFEALCATILATQSLAQNATPKYAADVPKSLQTPDTVNTKQLGTLKFFDGMPDETTVRKAYDTLDFMRGVEAFLRGLPVVSGYAVLEGLEKAGLKPGDMGIFEDLMDGRSLFLSPNPTTMYCMTELNLKDGPLVMEVPSGMRGTVADGLLHSASDIGNTGPDKGKGGKYLFVHTSYKGEIPDGCFVVKSRTYRNIAFFEESVNAGDLAGTAKAVKEKFRMYPLANAKNPPTQKFANLSGKKFNTIYDNNFLFYQNLDVVVQNEPTDAFDLELLKLLASIGIKKGQAFVPDGRMGHILIEAIAVGNTMARAVTFAPRNQNVYFYRDRHWYSPFADGNSDSVNDGKMALDNQIMSHYLATPQVSTGSASALAARDSQGNYLDGGKTYKVTLPAPVPVNNFWSFTVYDGQTRSMLETDQKEAGLGSNNPSLRPDADGSYTVWFGPTAPRGHEGNWIQTMPAKSYNVALRLDDPLAPWLKRTWKPGDFELVK